MALQALLEAQQQQNELLKQSLQQQQPPTSSSPHPASLQTSNTPVPVTVSPMPTPSYSPTVITVGNPRPPAAVAPPPASTIQRPPLLHTAATPVATTDVSQRQFVVAGTASSADARTRSRSPPSDRQQVLLPGHTGRSEDVVDTVVNRAVPVTFLAAVWHYGEQGRSQEFVKGGTKEGVQGQSPGGVWGKAPISRRHMLISSYDGACSAPMSSLSYATDVSK